MYRDLEVARISRQNDTETNQGWFNRGQHRAKLLRIGMKLPLSLART